MFKRLPGILIVSLCFSLVQAQVKTNMDYFYVYLNDLQPYLQKKAKFTDEKSRATVENLLKSMSENVKDLKLKKMSQNDDMRFRIQQLSEGLEEASQTYKDGFREYAFWVTKSSLYNCYSCHTEKGLPETKYKFSFREETSAFEKADFLFMIRNYTDSTNTFVKLINDYPKNKINLDELMISVKKVVYYYLRVKRDDEALLKAINGFLTNKELPLFMSRDMAQWKKYLEIKKYRIMPEAKPITDAKTLADFLDERNAIAEHFGEGQERFVVDQETLYFLHKTLTSELNQELKNIVYYWISKIQRLYRDSMFDSSAEIYLTECVKLTQVQDTAKKCAEEFKEQKLQSFDTRQVTELPNLIRKQIDDLDKKVSSLKVQKK